MTRSLAYLRRGILGIAFAGSLGYGATQAFAAPERKNPVLGRCDPTDPWEDVRCASACISLLGEQTGYCSDLGYCRCGFEP